MPNRFQRELTARNGIIAGRRWSWQTARRRRIPVELRMCREASAVQAENELLSTPAQRAFAILESAGAWRRLAGEYQAKGDHARARACKRAAHDHLFSAIRARCDTEAASAVMAAAE